MSVKRWKVKTIETLKYNMKNPNAKKAFGFLYIYDVFNYVFNGLCLGLFFYSFFSEASFIVSFIKFFAFQFFVKCQRLFTMHACINTPKHFCRLFASRTNNRNSPQR